MTDQQVSLLPLYKGWDNYQAQLVRAIEPLSLEQLKLESAPHLRSVGQNAAHIVGTRAGWMHFVLGRGGEEMVALAEWNQRNAPARSAPELSAGLEATWQVIHNTLSEWTIADLSELVQDTDDNGNVETYTRQWVIWHVIKHDIHHGGELSFTLGMHGLRGIDL